MDNFEKPTGPSTRLQPDGSLNLDTHTEHGGNKYREEDLAETSFILPEYNAKQQFIISQMASLIMNVANVFPYKTKEGKQEFMSPNVLDQFNYDPKKHVSNEDAALFGLLFGDLDHLGRDNHHGGVFFDFGASDMLKSEEAYEKKERVVPGSGYTFTEELNHERTYNYVDYWKKKGLLDIEAMETKCNELTSHLSGEQGLQFITALCKKAEYTELTPEKVQERFLSTIQKTLEKLADVK